MTKCRASLCAVSLTDWVCLLQVQLRLGQGELLDVAAAWQILYDYLLHHLISTTRPSTPPANKQTPRVHVFFFSYPFRRRAGRKMCQCHVSFCSFKNLENCSSPWLGGEEPPDNKLSCASLLKGGCIITRGEDSKWRLSSPTTRHTPAADSGLRQAVPTDGSAIRNKF